MLCSKCHVELMPVHDYLKRRGDFPQYENALVIDLSGAYGMLVDYINDGNPRFVLCKDCGTQFFKDNQWAVTPDSDEFLIEAEGEEDAE